MEEEIEQKNTLLNEKSSENNKELNLNEQNNIVLNQENNTDNPNINTSASVNRNLEKEENEEKAEELDFEQIKKNHMLMMNNINMSTFENELSSNNYQRAYNTQQANNQFNNYANYNNLNPNFTNIGFNNANIGLQGIPMPNLPNQGMIMNFAQQNPFIPAPPRFAPSNQMLMHNNQNYFFDCNPFALFMHRKVNTGYNKDNKKEEKEEKPFFFSFSNTLLTNNPNAKSQDDSNKGVDLTKMTRFNVKFINPFNGRVNQTDVLIETKHVKEYGEFHREWKEKVNPIEQTLPNNSKIITGYTINFTNEKSEKTVNLSPIFILLSLIDAKIDPSLVPEGWKTSKANDNFVKIKFKNSNKILYLNKQNKSIVDKIPRKLNSNKNANIPSTLNPFLHNNSNLNTINNQVSNKIINEAENTSTQKISFVEELENEDLKLQEAKIKKQQELELELKKKKEKKILSKLLGNKHYLLKDSGAEGASKNKKQKRENESDSDSEENIADEIDEGNFDLNLTVAELKIRYSNEIRLYKELLEENGVNIFTKFQEVLPKLIYDSRYLKVPKKIRERIFDEFVREKEAKDKEAKEKEEKEAEEKVNLETAEKAERENEEANSLLNFKNNEISFPESNEIDRFKETEKYSRKVKELDLKGKAKEEIERKMRKVSQERLKALIKSQIEKGEIHSNTPFSEFEARNINNPDFHNALQIDREFLFNEAKLKVKKLLEERKKNNIKKFKDMLFAKVSPLSITENTSVHEIKKQIKHAKEYELIASSQEKKDLILEFISEMQKLIAHSKNKSDVVAHKKELELKIAEEELKKFLSENIKTEISWEEANQKFFTASNSNHINNDKNNQRIFINNFLSEEKKLQIFKDFIYNLLETKKRLLRELYEERIGLNQDIAWHDVQHMLQNDKKFRDVIEREREALFIEYKAYVQERILAEFHQFLNETSLINKDSPTEGPLFNSLVSKLSADIRFQRLERNPDKRDKFLRAKIRSLKYEFEKKERNERKAVSAMNRDRDRDKDRDGINRDWREDKIYNKK